MHKEDTSTVQSNAPLGIDLNSFVFEIKFRLSFTSSVVGTYPLMYSQTSLLIVFVGWLTELQIGLHGTLFCVFWEGDRICPQYKC